ncbi:MAG: CNP1-like family protein [Dechloromonas sp.]|uniref:CNP1-like family protein n=1 Tax=Azonexus sp. TaxID=1872668 RepID=UPI0035B1031A|nr:CNP1-like family protein [Dechloromonas sp.]
MAILSSPLLADFDEDYDSKRWQEVEVQLPAPPRQDRLLPFYVSAVAENRFYVDASSLSVGSDGVVRYVLVILTPQGGRNVSYEGMRCETRERRIYASGRADGSWSKSRNNDWVRIADQLVNRHHAALYLEYFCPIGIAVRSPEEARDALLRGGHPDVRR